MTRELADRVYYLIFVKCLCETAGATYEKVLAEPLPKRMPSGERERVKQLQDEIRTAHQRVGELLARVPQD